MAQQLAALLAAATAHGRKAVDGLTCGEVARSMSIDIDTLADALLTLEREGLIAVDPQGRLILASPVALERFASTRPAAARVAA